NRAPRKRSSGLRKWRSLASKLWRYDSGQVRPRPAGVLDMTLAHGTDRVESARLLLRRVAPDDLPFFTRIHALPEVAQYLWVRPRSPEETATWLRGTLASYEQRALGHPAVVRKQDGALIGRCGRDYARDVLRLSYAISVIHPENVRSQHVAERSGARCAGQMEVIGLAWDRYLWPLAAGGETRPQPVSTK